MLCRTNSRIGIDLCSFLRFCLAPLRGSSFTRPVLFVGVVFSCQQQKLCFDLLRLPFEKHANETKKESVDSNVKPPPPPHAHTRTHAHAHTHTRTHAPTHRCFFGAIQQRIQILVVLLLLLFLSFAVVLPTFHFWTCQRKLCMLPTIFPTCCRFFFFLVCV